MKLDGIASETEMAKYGFNYGCDVTDGNGNYATLLRLVRYGDRFEQNM